LLKTKNHGAHSFESFADIDCNKFYLHGVDSGYVLYIADSDGKVGTINRDSLTGYNPYGNSIAIYGNAAFPGTDTIVNVAIAELMVGDYCICTPVNAVEVYGVTVTSGNLEVRRATIRETRALVVGGAFNYVCRRD